MSHEEIQKIRLGIFDLGRAKQLPFSLYLLLIYMLQMESQKHSYEPLPESEEGLNRRQRSLKDKFLHLSIGRFIYLFLGLGAGTLAGIFFSMLGNAAKITSSIYPDYGSIQCE